MFKEAFIPANGITLHVIEHGEGPAVLLCHGFPETWRSWRRQIEALAEAGFRVIAPDMRGYGGSSTPESAAEYTQLHIVGDLIGLLDALNIAQATVMGHDWGAIAAWNAALLRPDRFTRVAGLSVPYVARGEVNLLEQFRAGRDGFYMLQFQKPATDAALALDVAGFLTGSYHSASADAKGDERWKPFIAAGATRESGPTTALLLPNWLDPGDFTHAVESFERTGFHGGLNWYRAMQLTFELMAPFKDARIMQPALFIVGREDPVLEFALPFVEMLPSVVPGLTGSLVIDGAGHWVGQEVPAAVNAALIKFLAQHS